jgi:hypothetical protein
MWSDWFSVADGRATPGAPVCIVPTFETLVIADPGGQPFTTYGDPDLGWGSGWKTVAQGLTLPGGSVNALGYGPLSGPNRLPTKMAVFLVDPNAGVYAAGGDPQRGWGPGWAPVHWGNSKPGSPVTALQYGNQIAVFIADTAGGIWTSVGTPEAGFGAWSSVSQGRTPPGSLVAALPIGGNRFLLFLTDPNGGVYVVSGGPDAGWGPWTYVKGIKAPPGASVAVFGGIQFMLLVTDINGEIKTAVGDADLNWWPPPSTVSQPPLALLPGSPVTAIAANGINLFVTDSNGHVWTTSSLDSEVPIQSTRWAPWSTVSPVSGVGKPGAPVSASVFGLSLCLVMSDAKGDILITAQSNPVLESSISNRLVIT